MEIVVPEAYRHLYVTDSERPVVKIPEPVLRRRAEPVAKPGPRHRVILENMARIMQRANGIGLAAPQIGLSERLIVIAPDRRVIGLINPEILERQGSQVGEEGCLSIPGLYGDVERSQKILVRAIDRKGKQVELEVTGLAARIVQHEIDHLDGVLFTDKVDPATLHWRDPDGDAE
ncbi:MAG: peptide deformylase [Fimbriimonadaceae bacterium]|nr:peptide deformylase [Fimbriimonadaceae bacterium]